jgi:hypothetical protein
MVKAINLFLPKKSNLFYYQAPLNTGRHYFFLVIKKNGRTARRAKQGGQTRL